jgi:hypothetical protein
MTVPGSVRRGSLKDAFGSEGEGNVALTGSRCVESWDETIGRAPQQELLLRARTMPSPGRKRRRGTMVGASLIISSVLLPYTASAVCVPLANSTTCNAFPKGQISTSNSLKSQ